MEAGKPTLHESMQFAQELEVIHHDKSGRKIAAVTTTTASVSDMPVTEEEEEDDFTEEEIKAINVIRFRQGKLPFNPNFGRFNRNRNISKSISVRNLAMCKKTARPTSVKQPQWSMPMGSPVKIRPLPPLPTMGPRSTPSLPMMPIEPHGGLYRFGALNALNC